MQGILLFILIITSTAFIIYLLRNATKADVHAWLMDRVMEDCPSNLRCNDCVWWDEESKTCSLQVILRCLEK